MTRGPRIITDDTRAEMKKILREIQDGQFAKEWVLENQANRPHFNALRERDRNHLIEKVGRDLRAMMSWIAASSGKTQAQTNQKTEEEQRVNLRFANLGE